MSNLYYLYRPELESGAIGDYELALQGASILLDAFLYGPNDALTSEEYVDGMTKQSQVMHLVLDSPPLESTPSVVAASTIEYEPEALGIASMVFIDQLAVDEAHRGRGHARALLGDIATQAYAECMRGIILDSLTSATGLYEKHGFEFVDVGSPAHVMTAVPAKVIKAVARAASKSRYRQDPSDRIYYRYIQQA